MVSSVPGSVSTLHGSVRSWFPVHGFRFPVWFRGHAVKVAALRGTVFVALHIASRRHLDCIMSVAHRWPPLSLALDEGSLFFILRILKVYLSRTKPLKGNFYGSAAKPSKDELQPNSLRTALSAQPAHPSCYLEMCFVYIFLRCSVAKSRVPFEVGDLAGGWGDSLFTQLCIGMPDHSTLGYFSCCLCLCSGTGPLTTEFPQICVCF